MELAHKMTAARKSLSMVRPRRQKPHREDLHPEECLCSHCPAKCCNYFALPIDTPTTWTEFEYIRWFLLHDRAAMFIEEGDWYLLVYTRCKHLGRNNLCGIYLTRPKICRDYSTTKCEYEDNWVYDHYFEAPEQIEEYAEAVLGPRRGRGVRSPRPELLGIVDAEPLSSRTPLC
jgi:uncharacterized protein